MKGGDNAMEFEEAYRKYFNDVYLYVRRLSGDEHIAEEITSDTFYKALYSINKFRGDCDIRVWLCQIAKNSYFAYIKKRRNTANLDDEEVLNLIDDNILIDDAIIQKDESMQIKKILHTISEPYREVFMWRVFAELSFKQIGQIFGKSDNWACVTYHRSKEMIQQRLEENNNEK